MRTTVDIDEPILSAVKSVQASEGKALGRVVSDLLAVGLSARRTLKPSVRKRFHWTSKSMGAQVDLADRDVVYRVLDEGRK